MLYFVDICFIFIEVMKNGAQLEYGYRYLYYTRVLGSKGIGMLVQGE